MKYYTVLKYLIALVVCFNSLIPVESIEPITTSILGVSSLFAVGFYALKCKVFECCDESWINPNITGLAHVMRNDLHGQHLAIDTILKSVRGHLSDRNPSKALVLSMHGWTGGGKNYVSRFITNHLYRKSDSEFVHLFVATLHFPHKDYITRYKDQLAMWIKGNVTACPRSVFIFDEMDKMPEGLIDSVKPFIDHYTQLDGVDYRKAIFLFLSNSGGNDITKRTLEHWQAGRKREDITLKEMEDILKLGAYNEQGGLWHADLISKNLISAFVPFLPLERSHVKSCIRDDLRRKHFVVSETIVDKVADELQYFPKDSKVFSTSGCKRVSEKVNFVMEDY